jgi:hypothetical protein
VFAALVTPNANVADVLFLIAAICAGIAAISALMKMENPLVRALMWAAVCEIAIGLLFR